MHFNPIVRFELCWHHPSRTGWTETGFKHSDPKKVRARRNKMQKDFPDRQWFIMKVTKERYE